MSKCDLKIVPDRTDRKYAPGDKITGIVEVHVNKECKCRKLTLTREWRTHGRGNRTSGGKHETILFEGTWMPGEEIAYSFEMDAPNGPVTYHGHYLNVDWYLRARADIPWAIDPKADEEFLLAPGKADAEVDFGPKYVPPGERYLKGKKKGCMFVLGLFFVLTGLGVTGLGIFVEMEPSWIFLIMGAVSLLIGFAIAYFAIRNVLAQRKLGPVNVRLSSGVVRPGDAIALKVGFRPTDKIDLERITAKLEGKEVVVSGSGTNRTTHTHVLHKQDFEVSPSRRLSPGEEVNLETSLPIPADAPTTFAASDNSLTWSINLHIYLDRWPDWTREYPITVRP